MEKLKSGFLLGKIYSDFKNDDLLHYTLPYYSLIALYGLFSLSYLTGSSFYPTWFIFGIIPLLDHYIKHDVKNPTKAEQKIMKNEFRYKIPIYLTMVADWALLIWGICQLVNENCSYMYKLGMLLVLGVLQASSINLSHEINHKLNKWERIIGTFNLSKNLYTHFFIEHNEGHHKNVGTPNDPATSKLNQTFYEFLPQSLKGGFKSAWNIENRLCRQHYGTEFTYKNRMIYSTLSTFGTTPALYFIFGFKVALSHLLIASSSVVILEAINYLEHYGLQRKKLEDGTYENVNITHSWNAPHRVSNYVLLKLQRHSDHHENSLKPYQTLCTYDESPELPNGYAVCLILSFFPSLWFEIMNPLVEAFNDGRKPSEEVKKKTSQILMNFIIKMNIILVIFVLLGHSF